MPLANMFCAAGIGARHDQHVNGHCDLVISASGNFMWLGEAKVHSSYDWLVKGFGQLSTRCGTAMVGRDCGELIIYHRKGNAHKCAKGMAADRANDRDGRKSDRAGYPTKTR